MAAQRASEAETDAPMAAKGILKRRGLIAGAAALVAGVLATKTSQSVAAGDDQAILIGHSGTATTQDTAGTETILSAASGALFGSSNILKVTAQSSSLNVSAIEAVGSGTGAGVRGFGGSSGTGTGLLGQGGGTLATNAAGVVGYGPGLASSSTFFTNAGVAGFGQIFGVYGEVMGSVGDGVKGVGGVSIGVRGTATSGRAVVGDSDTGFGVAGTTGGTGVVAGVYGTSSTAYGIIGNTTASGYSGLTAITSTVGVAALAATSTAPNAFAAYFSGATVVQGNFTVFGGAKNAAVPHPDGSHRLVYCVESPESWFEDFGKAKLVNGKADVKLDADFAAVVHVDDYYVFLTEYSDHHLHVTAQTAGGFTVEADRALAALKGKAVADLSGTFAYRVVARRKDIAGERLAKFTLPKINHPDPDRLPKPAGKP